MRVLLAVIAVAGILVACSESPTDPAVNRGPSYGGYAYGCPGAFTQTSGVFTEEDPARLADENADGVVCYLDVVKPTDGTIRRTYVDNLVPNRVATCPSGFSAPFETYDSGVDRNGDGTVCQARRPNGSVVTVDNHFDNNPNN
jgi:hypothetical protein